MQKKNLTRLSVEVSKEIKRKFARLCKKSDTDMSREVREFIRIFIRNKEIANETRV